MVSSSTGVNSRLVTLPLLPNGVATTHKSPYLESQTKMHSVYATTADNLMPAYRFPPTLLQFSTGLMEPVERLSLQHFVNLPQVQPKERSLPELA